MRVAVLVAFGLCVLGLFRTWTRVAVFDRSYQLGRARGEGARLARELQRLKLEVATQQATARVDREARGKLAMEKPPPARVVVLGREPGTAVPLASGPAQLKPVALGKVAKPGTKRAANEG